jgi:hypothetical protein
METKADPENGEPEAEILVTIAGTVDGRPSSKDNPPATGCHILSGRGIRHYPGIDIHIPECAVNQVVELPEIIDHIDGAHLVQFW